MDTGGLQSLNKNPKIKSNIYRILLCLQHFLYKAIIHNSQGDQTDISGKFYSLSSIHPRGPTTNSVRYAEAERMIQQSIQGWIPLIRCAMYCMTGENSNKNVYEHWFQSTFFSCATFGWSIKHHLAKLWGFLVCEACEYLDVKQYEKLLNCGPI